MLNAVRNCLFAVMRCLKRIQRVLQCVAEVAKGSMAERSVRFGHRLHATRVQSPLANPATSVPMLK